MFLKKISVDEFIYQLDSRIISSTELYKKLKRVKSSQTFYKDLPQDILFNRVFRYSKYSNIFIEILNNLIKYNYLDKIYFKYRGFNFLEYHIYIQLLEGDNYRLYSKILDILEKNNIELRFNIAPNSLSIVGMLSKPYLQIILPNHYISFIRKIIKVDKYIFYKDSKNRHPNLLHIFLNQDFRLLNLIYEEIGLSNSNFISFINNYFEVIKCTIPFFIILQEDTIFDIIMKNRDISFIDTNLFHNIENKSDDIYKKLILKYIDNITKKREFNSDKEYYIYMRNIKILTTILKSK